MLLMDEQTMYTEKKRRLTTFVEEKKSINLPTVKGMLIETEEDTRSNPIAASKGFFSGFARDTILPNDDALSEAVKLFGSSRESMEGRGGGSDFSAIPVEFVEYALFRSPQGSPTGTKQCRVKPVALRGVQAALNKTWRQHATSEARDLESA